LTVERTSRHELVEFRERESTLVDRDGLTTMMTTAVMAQMARDNDSFFRDIFRDADDVRATNRHRRALGLSRHFSRVQRREHFMMCLVEY